MEAHPVHLTQVLLHTLPHFQAQIQKPRGKNLRLGQACILCAVKLFSISLFLQMQCLEASLGCASGKRCSYQCRKVMWHEIQHNESSLLCIRHWIRRAPHTLQMGVSGIFPVCLPGHCSRTDIRDAEHHIWVVHMDSRVRLKSSGLW